MEFGITSFGAYIPRLRIERKLIAEAHAWMAPSLGAQAKGSRAFCSWDEDAVTMAVEAARDCLRESETQGLASLFLASTTLPYADLQSSSIVAGALRLPPGLATVDVGNSQRAATSALIQAFKAREEAVVIGSDAPVGKPASAQELQYGAGAAAFRIGEGQIIAKCLSTASVTEPFVDHFRASGARHDYFWEERWIRDEGYLKIAPRAATAALARAGLEIGDIHHLVIPSLLKGAASAVAKKLSFEGAVAGGLEDGCGHAGTAHVLLMLASLLEQAKAGERILVIGFGQGADAIILERTAAAAPASQGVSGALANGTQNNSYLKMLSFADLIDLEWGMRSEKVNKTPLTEQYRSAEQLEGFVAGRCGACGTVQFPRLEYCVKPECHAPASQFDDVPLAGETCQVVTYTADWLSYYPAPPLYVGFVQFENGARMLMEIVDVGPEGIDVGTPLLPIFRIKDRDRARGYNRYFWKATPIASRGN